MARADYIWIVVDGSHLIAAFTVKHELIRWLRTSRTGWTPGRVDCLEVHRARDGGHRGDPVLIGTAAELLAEADRG